MKHPMRLAFVSNTLWSIVHFRMKVIMDQLDRGCTVFLIAPVDDTRSRLPRHERLIFVPLFELSAHGRSLFADLRLQRELETIYLECRPDIIFHYTVKPNIWGTLASCVLPGVRTVSVITGLGQAFQSSRLLRFAVIRLYRRALRHATETWFLNDGDRDLFRRLGIIPPKQGFLMPGEGIDCEKFTPCPLPSPADRVEFLMIARVKAAKGVREYAEASAILRRRFPDARIRCTLLGRHHPDDPDTIPTLEFHRWVEDQTLIWHGHRSDVRSAICEADVMVLPSHGEGLSLSLMEGASCERPLITTDVPGCRELVRDGESGWICRPRDAKALADAMEKAWRTSPDQRAAMGKKGRAFMVSTYDERIILSHYQARLEVLAPKD